MQNIVAKMLSIFGMIELILSVIGGILAFTFYKLPALYSVYIAAGGILAGLIIMGFGEVIENLYLNRIHSGELVRVLSDIKSLVKLQMKNNNQ